jgi:hypothetical protein
MSTAIGTFKRIGDHLHRTSAYIQWGTSARSLGSCLLLNPGAARFGRSSKNLETELKLWGKATGPIDTDPTMGQLVAFIESIYDGSSLDGRFHIYNLFTLQNPKSEHAIDLFESLVSNGQLDPLGSLVPMDELRVHPWMLLGWGCEQRSQWRHLPKVKDAWLNLIERAGIPSFGKLHPKGKGYYHPCPLIPTRRPPMLRDLLDTFNTFQEYQISPLPKSEIQFFPSYATRPNLLISTKEPDVLNMEPYGWMISPSDPEHIVRGYSHLGIRTGYKLQAYQFRTGGGGNGIVWAIPDHFELSPPNNTNEFYEVPPRPPFALDDFMQSITGDQTPMSYLQAAIVLHELWEFGAEWHGVEWGEHTVLPRGDDVAVDDDSDDEDESPLLAEHWIWEDTRPEKWEPRFFYSVSGHPTVVFFTECPIGYVNINRFTHTFSKDDYTQRVHRAVVATGGPGIIF